MHSSAQNRTTYHNCSDHTANDPKVADVVLQLGEIPKIGAVN